MQTRSSAWLWYLGAWLSACGPAVQPEPALPSEEGRRYGQAVCAAAQRCGCLQPFHDASGSCDDVFAARFDAVLARGLRVDAACLEEVVAALAEDPCSTERVEPLGQCVVMRGDAGPGASCSADPYLGVATNDCAGDLRCFAGRCANAESPVAKQEGDACWASSWLSCYDPRLYCGVDGRCRTREPEGAACRDHGCEVCAAGEPCLEYLYCRGGSPSADGVCAKTPSVGDACEPLDWLLCGTPGGPTAHCNPNTAICDEGAAPRVCWIVVSETHSR
jgi:hypothetical protein